MPKTDTKTEQKKQWDAEAELNRFAPLEEAIKAPSDDWTTLTERAQGQITDALKDSKTTHRKTLTERLMRHT